MGRKKKENEMRKSQITILAIAVVLISLLVPSLSYALNPKIIKIGVITSGPTGLETIVPVFEELVEPDINAYAAKLNRHRFNPPVQFDFIIESAEYSSQIHLEKMQMFHEMGVDVIIGAPWSSMAAASLDYINENNMLLISPASTSPILAIPDDNLFRLSPDDTHQGPAIAGMLLSKGIEAAIVIQRADAWGDGLFSAITAEFESNGGVISAHIAYDPGTTDFTPYVASAEDAAVVAVGLCGADHVGVIVLSFLEIVDIVLEAEGYPTIYSLLWFGADGTARVGDLLTHAPDQADHLKIYSTLTAPTYSSKFYEMAVRFETLLGYDIGYYALNYIDAAWIVVQSVLESHPQNTAAVSASDVKNVLFDVTSRYFGYSGWCLLNEAGDRAAVDYEIWGYGFIDVGWPDHILYGSYHSVTGEVTWN